jgi:polar amino acid transport system permease protein
LAIEKNTNSEDILMEVLKLMPRFLEGLQLTLGLWAITLILSLPLAFPVAFIRSSKNRIVSGATKFYIDIMRGTPLLLQMCFIFFGLPEVGIVFPRFTTAVIAFVINYTAYFAEIFRSGLKSIDKGQWEAGKSLGLTQNQILMKIILPQSFKRIIPPLANEFIVLIKDSSLVSTIGVYDLMQTSNILGGKYYNYFVPMIGAALAYLVLTLVISHFTMKLEKRLAESD